MHYVQSKSMRYTLATAGMVASAIFLLASMVANARYGYSLARTSLDGYVYAAAGVAGDIFMAACPFFFFTALRNREVLQSLAAALVWAAMTAFAAQAVVSHASVNRLDAISVRTGVATTYQDTRTELTEARKTRGFIPQHRPEAVMAAEMEKHKTSRVWSQTNECTEATGKAGREYCATYQSLKAELGYAQQASKLDARIAALVEKSDKVSEGSTAANSEADPSANTWADLTGLSTSQVRSWQAFLVAFIVLLGAGMGFYISAAVLTEPKARAPRSQSGWLARWRQGTVVDITPTEVPAPADALKLEAAKAPLQIAKPADPARPEPSPEWRELLDAIGYPRKKGLREAQRPQDKREIVGLRWFVWLAAHGHVGEFTATRIEQLYDEFANGDYPRDRWGINVAKGELRTAAKAWIVVRDSRPPTLWTISMPTLARLKQLMVKRKLLDATTAKAAEAAPADPKPAEVAGESGVPFVSAASGPPSAPSAPANDDAPSKPRKPLQGLAELSRHLPDLRTMGRLERVNKIAWRARAWMPHKKQQNRMSRIRAA